MAVNIGARSARSPWHKVTKAVTTLYARLTTTFKGATHRKTVDEVAHEWQRMFPSGVAVKEVRDGTAYGEIRAECPLRDTGDVEACYRMMEYDRAMLGVIGGEFVVLKSQAEPGVRVCEVAIRRAGEGTHGLDHAHERVKRRLPLA